MASAGFRQAGGGTTWGNGSSSSSSSFSGLSGNPKDIWDAYQKAYEGARQANLSRYSDILGGYGDRTSTVMNELNTVTGQERSDIMDAYGDMRAKNMQNMVSRGLSGTTVMPTMNMGIQREENNALGRHYDKWAQTRANAQAGLQKDRLDFMERREDAYPDASMYLGLMQMANANRPAGGGSSYTPAAPRRWSGSTTLTPGNSFKSLSSMGAPIWAVNKIRHG